MLVGARRIERAREVKVPVYMLGLGDQKDINVGVNGFINDFSNSHTIEGAIAPTPEPATLLLLGSTLAGLGAVIRKRRLR